MPVRITAQPFVARHGRLMNLSVSGASINADFELRPLSRIQVVIELPHCARSEAPSIAAYVIRSSKGNIGIEWCEFAPPEVSGMLQTLSARRYIRVRKPDLPGAIAITRLSAPLLKHGS
jgi:hypothetical protein